MAAMELILLFKALESPNGIEVKTSDLRLARQRFYAARKSSPDLEILQIRQCPYDAQTLWITKAGSPLAEPDSQPYRADPLADDES